MDNTNPASANPTPSENQASNPAPTQVSAPVPPANPVPAQGKKSSAGLIIGVIVGVVVLLFIIGIIVVVPLFKGIRDGIESIDIETGGDTSISSDNAIYNTKGNCKFYECLTKVTQDTTKEDAETIFGFAPEEEIDEDGDSAKYTWTFDEDHTIVMNTTTFMGKTSTVTIKLDEYNKDELKQDGVVFDNVNEIKSNLNVGDGVNYDQFKEYMGGVDGILIEVGMWNKYEWRSTEVDGYMDGSFGSSGKCMFMSGMTY